MDIILGLLESLKIDNTIFIQFGIFLIGYLALYYVLFKPYNEAAQTRYEKTSGSENLADQYNDEIEMLKRKYGEKVKSSNVAVKDIYKEFDAKAKKESTQMILNAESVYRKDKEAKEQELNNLYKNEKAKVPELSKELKEQLRKVLVGA